MDEERPVGVVPQEVMSGAKKSEKARIKEALEEKRIADFEPDILDKEEKQTLLNVIDGKIKKTKDKERQALLVELRDFIAVGDTLFAHFAQGTSSDALVSIVQNGLYVRSKATELMSESDALVLGEGGRGGGKNTDNNIFAGAGVGGIGTAMAYAVMIDDPRWNFNHIAESELQQSVEEYDRLLQIRDNEYIKWKLKNLQKALQRKQAGVETDYPLVVGFARTSRIATADEIPLNQWRTRAIFAPDRPVTEYSQVSVAGGTWGDNRNGKENHSLDSEVWFIDDEVGAGHLLILLVLFASPHSILGGINKELMQLNITLCNSLHSYRKQISNCFH